MATRLKLSNLKTMTLEGHKLSFDIVNHSRIPNAVIIDNIHSGYQVSISTIRAYIKWLREEKDKIYFTRENHIVMNGRIIGKIERMLKGYSVYINGIEYGKWVWIKRCKEDVKSIIDNDGLNKFKEYYL